MAQYGVDDELPLQPIGALDGASWHQPVALAGYVNRLRLSMFLGVCKERTGLGVESHFWVSTHIDDTVEARLQIFNVESELVHIGPSGRLIQILVKLSDVSLFRGQSLFFLLTSTFFLPK